MIDPFDLQSEDQKKRFEASSYQWLEEFRTNFDLAELPKIMIPFGLKARWEHIATVTNIFTQAGNTAAPWSSGVCDSNYSFIFYFSSETDYALVRFAL